MSNSLRPHGLTQSMEFSRPEYWSGPFPSPGDLPNPGIELRSSTLQADCQLSHKGSPRILKWVAYPFSSGFSQSRNRTRVSCIAGDSLPTELSGKPCFCQTNLNSNPPLQVAIYVTTVQICLFGVFCLVYRSRLSHLVSSSHLEGILSP